MGSYGKIAKTIWSQRNFKLNQAYWPVIKIYDISNLLPLWQATNKHFRSATPTRRFVELNQAVWKQAPVAHSTLG